MKMNVLSTQTSDCQMHTHTMSVRETNNSTRIDCVESVILSIFLFSTIPVFISLLQHIFTLIEISFSHFSRCVRCHSCAFIHITKTKFFHLLFLCLPIICAGDSSISNLIAIYVIENNIQTTLKTDFVLFHIDLRYITKKQSFSR